MCMHILASKLMLTDYTLATYMTAIFLAAYSSHACMYDIFYATVAI